VLPRVHPRASRRAMAEGDEVRDALNKANLAAYADFFRTEGYEELGDLPATREAWSDLASAAHVKRGHQNRWDAFVRQSSSSSTTAVASAASGSASPPAAAAATLPSVDKGSQPRPQPHAAQPGDAAHRPLKKRAVALGGSGLRTGESSHRPLTHTDRTTPHPCGKHDQPNSATVSAGATQRGAYVMLSYQWGVQRTVLRVREALKQRKVGTWMDVDGGVDDDVSDAHRCPFIP
jgi:hypothetical protein